MPNIVLNTNCNLKCPYCFADNYTHSETMSFTDKNFETAKEFILSGSQNTTVGIIGGEPTLHENFSKYVLNLSSDDRVKTVIIYTNGILLEKYPNVISNEKVRFLINCNPRDVIGENNHDMLMSSLKAIAKHNSQKVSIGVNIYEGRQDYSFILDAIRIVQRDMLRVSITVPNSRGTTKAFKYFSSLKPTVIKFFTLLAENNITPYFDCNHLPSCFITHDDIAEFSDNIGIEAMLMNSWGNTISCRPVIDVFPDLTAIRCFGMSKSTVAQINDFANINDLYHYYLRTVDAFAHNIPMSSKCNGCYKMKTAKCTGGCFSYKNDKIELLKEKIGNYRWE